MHIGYVLGAFPVLSETFISNEIRVVRKLGHLATPVTLTDYTGSCQVADEIFKSELVRMQSVSATEGLFRMIVRPDRFFRAFSFAVSQKGIPTRSLMLAGAKVAVIAIRNKFTHLHAHFAHAPAATAIVAARLSGLTCSFTGHGYDVYGDPHDLPEKLTKADFVIAVCRDMAADFALLASSASIETVHCGVDPERFHPAREGVKTNGRILAIGRLAPQKGYDVLFAALAQIPESERPVVDIVGAGGLKDALLSDVLRLGIADSVNFLGARDSKWIASEGPYYAGFVAPYVITPNGDRDTGPLVVKEAMAMGLPVVASSLMGLKEIVSEDTGRLVPTGDSRALSEALIWMSGLSEDVRKKMGQNGRARVKEFFTIEGQGLGLIQAIEKRQKV